MLHRPATGERTTHRNASWLPPVFKVRAQHLGQFLIKVMITRDKEPNNK